MPRNSMTRLDRFYPRNVEGLSEWDIPETYWKNRPRGISAMVRLMNEADWVIPSLDSIVKWCDEVALFLQGPQTDGTDKLVRKWVEKHPDKAAYYEYPFLSLPNGPGHDQQRRASLYERAYFYNWCMARTRFSHAMKWDGDMVAFDWLGAELRELVERDHKIISFRGLNMHGDGFSYLAAKARTACEPRLFEVNRTTFFYSGHKCEYFTWDHNSGTEVPRDAFLHFKWAKPLDSATKDWPENWDEVPSQKNHFNKLMTRAARGAPYLGEVPSVLTKLRWAR